MLRSALARNRKSENVFSEYRNDDTARYETSTRCGRQKDRETRQEANTLPLSNGYRRVDEIYSANISNVFSSDVSVLKRRVNKNKQKVSSICFLYRSFFYLKTLIKLLTKTKSNDLDIS